MDGSGFRNVEGSRGGKSTGKFTFLSGQTYKIQVGSRGEDGANLSDGNDAGEGGFPGGAAAPSLGSDFNRSGKVVDILDFSSIQSLKQIQF